MTKPLDERFRDAQSALGQMQVALAAQPGKLPPDLSESLTRFADSKSEVNHWLDLFTARKSALRILDQLEHRANEEGVVQWLPRTDGADLPPITVDFRSARILGVQSYVAACWALSDRIASFAGRILCTERQGHNPVHPVELVSGFIGKDAAKSAAAPFMLSMRAAFGWPICVSYAIRNQFIHAADVRYGIEFFEGGTRESGFRIAAKAWNSIEDQARLLGADETQHRRGDTWLSSPADDLRLVLKVCEEDMDDALGVLLGSACQTLKAHLGFMLSED